MENILYNISQVLGITIIHSLWQGLLIYFLLRMVLLLAGSILSAANKYVLAVCSLLTITAWFAYTLVNQIQVYDWLATPANLANMPLMLELPAGMQHFNETTIRYYYSIEKYLPYITGIYVAGLLLNAARLVLARRKIRVIKHTMSLDVPLQQQMSRFAEKFGITKKIKVGLSKMVDVPCIVGYFKPVILLPFTLSTYLAADEIEAILMHELAHIKRNDYILNLVQQVITALLFFNPCVLLINKIIGEERENSCDDMVVDATQSPFIYAKALFKLEQTRQNELQLALAVTGKKYQLLTRIERIMKTKKQIPSIRPTLVAMLILTLSVCSLALLNPEIAEGKISVKAITPAINHLLTDTIPKKAVKARKATAKTTAKNSVVYKDKVKAAKLGKTYYNYTYNPGMDDPELERLGKEIEKHGDVISKYFDSPEFKAKSEEMDRIGKEMDAFYNSPEIKEATAAQEKAAAEFERNWAGKTGNIEKTGKEMEAIGKKIEQYYNSPEFKKINERLTKKYGISNDEYHNDGDENYRKYQAELQQNIPAQVKEQTTQLRKLGEEMRSRTNSPEIRKAQEEMRASGDRMRKAYQNPDIKAQQEKMRQLGAEMRSYTQNEQIKKEQQLIREASAKMKAYMNTPELKKKLQEFKKTHPERFGWNYDNNNNNNNNNSNNNIDESDRPEKPEKPEKAEKPEKPEAPETNR